jgi:hypothetical protein
MKSIFISAQVCFPKNNLHPCGIRTRVFYSSGRCDDNSARPSGQYVNYFLSLHYIKQVPECIPKSRGYIHMYIDTFKTFIWRSCPRNALCTYILMKRQIVGSNLSKAQELRGTNCMAWVQKMT